MLILGDVLQTDAYYRSDDRCSGLAWCTLSESKTWHIMLPRQPLCELVQIHATTVASPYERDGWIWQLDFGGYPNVHRIGRTGFARRPCRPPPGTRVERSAVVYITQKATGGLTSGTPYHIPRSSITQTLGRFPLWIIQE